jgi:hypothetical protein
LGPARRLQFDLAMRMPSSVGLGLVAMVGLVGCVSESGHDDGEPSDDGDGDEYTPFDSKADGNSALGGPCSFTARSSSKRWRARRAVGSPRCGRRSRIF